MTENNKLSVIVPCLNEEASLLELDRCLDQVLSKCQLTGLIAENEVIYVDDGSTDNSYSRLREMAQTDQRKKIIRFTKNFGHQAAIGAGLKLASGSAVVIIDADLQDPPELIENLVRKWREGFKVVHTIRKKRLGETILKKVTAWIYYKLINWLADLKFPENSGDFKLLDREVVDYIINLREHHRYLRGLAVLPGYRQTHIEYDRNPRFSGKTKYPFYKSLGLAIDGITSFSSKTLRLIALLGVLGLISSIFIFLYAISGKIFFPQVTRPGWTSLLIVVTFFSGLQLFSLGIMGEYISKIFDELKNRPEYVILDQINI